MKDVISKAVIFNHSIDKVWNAISKAEEISKPGLSLPILKPKRDINTPSLLLQTKKLYRY